MKQSIYFLACFSFLVFGCVAIRAQQPELVMQLGHNDGAAVVGFIQNGKILITRSGEESNLPTAFTIKIWEVETGRLLLTIPSVNPMQLSPDGKFLTTTNFDNTIKLWDLTTGQLIQTFKAQSLGGSITFSPDSRVLAGLIEVEKDSTFIVTHIQTMEVTSGVTRMYPQSNDRPEAKTIVFTNDGDVVRREGVVSPNNQFLAHTITKDEKNNLIELREAVSSKLLRTISVTGYVDDTVVEISPDSKMLRVKDALWNVATGEKLPPIKASIDSVYDIKFSPDASILALSGVAWRSTSLDQGIVELFDITSGRLLQSFKGSHGSISTVGFSPDNKKLACGSRVGNVELWDVDTGQRLPGISGYSNRADSVFFSPDGRSLVITDGGISSDRPPSFVLWSLVNGAEPRRFDGEFQSFSTDARRLLFRSKIPKTESKKEDEKRRQVASYDYFNIKVLDVETGAKIRTLDNAFSTTEAIATSPNGKLLASEPCCEHVQGQVKINIWSVETGKLVRSIERFAGEITFIEFSPDSTLMAIGVKGEIVFGLWEVATGKQLRRMDSGEVSAVTFSPNGKQLASVSGGMAQAAEESEITVKVWSVESGKLLHSRELSVTSLMSDIRYSPDSTLLAGSSLYVDLIGAVTGDKLYTLNVGDGSVGGDLVASAFFSPDSKLLLSAVTHSIGTRIQIWDTATGNEVAFLNKQSEDAQAADFNPDGKTFVTLGRDGLIRIWDLQSGEVIASLAVLDQNDWLVAANNGRFDGSPGAWNKLIWRFSESISTIAPVEIFFNEFYSPGLLADTMSGKRFQATRKIEQLDRRQPQLKLTRAGEQSVTSDRDVNVKIEVTEAPKVDGSTSGSGAQDVRLFRNGSLIKFWRGDVLKGQSSVALEARIKIVAGENKLTAYAFNRDNIKSSDATFVVNGSDNLKRVGTLYVLAIGVGQYANSDFDLDYTPADARDFGDEIRRQQELLKEVKLGRYMHIKTVPLLNKAATKANILIALERLAGVETGKLPDGAPAVLVELQPSQPEDGVIIFFSGHGTAQKDRFYLIPHDIGYMGSRKKVTDVGVETILAHSISDVELEEAFRGIDAGELMLIIDACNSGQTLQAEDWRRGPMNTKGLAQLAYEKGMYILTASQSVELAYESEALKHSYMTYALIEEGLKSRARESDANRDGQIWLREWFDFAVQRVPRMREKKIEQSARSQNKSLEIVEVSEQAKIQTPRVFYRREPDARPWIVAQSK